MFVEKLALLLSFPEVFERGVSHALGVVLHGGGDQV